MNTETLFTSYRTVEHYHRIIGAVGGRAAAPAVRLKAIDAYLMKQIAACYPAAPIVIDLAGGATGGASTIFWASVHPAITRVIAPRRHQDTTGASGWQRLVAGAVDRWEIEPNALVLPDAEVDDPDALAALCAELNPLSPVLITLAGPDSGLSLANLPTWADRITPAPVIFMLPLGSIGESQTLQALVAACGPESPYRLAAVRELRAFFASSQLGLIYRRDNRYMPDILTRIGQVFDGNFDFLTLVENNVALRLQLRRLEADGARRTISAPNDGNPPALPVPAVSSSASAAPASLGEPAESPLMYRLRGTLGIKIAKAGLPAIGRVMLPSGHLSYQVQYLGFSVPHQVQAGTVVEGMLKFQNKDTGPWLSASQSDRCVNLSYHWYNEDGTLLVKEGLRTPMTSTVQVGETASATFNILTPDRPGKYLLQPDLVHESVTWFSESGPAAPKFPVEVRY